MLKFHSSLQFHLSFMKHLLVSFLDMVLQFLTTIITDLHTKGF
jgi:hypothetical protein